MPRFPQELTLDHLAIFVGGQAEIQNQIEKYLYRGTIRTIAIEEDESKDSVLRIRFEWLAKGEGYPGPITWVQHKNELYEASIALFEVHDIGSAERGSSRLFLLSPVTNEMVLLIPPDGSRLEPPATLNETSP